MQQIGNANGGDEHRKAWGLAQWLVGYALDKNAQQSAAANGDEDADKGVHPQVEQGHERDVATNHDDVAVGKVEHLRNAVDHGVAQSDNGVHAA